MVSDVAQIYQLWKAYAAALTAGDMERWIALWTDDGIQMPPGAPRRVGVEQIRASMQPLFDLYQWAITINPEEVRVLGDRAYSHGTYEFALTPKEDGETMEGSSKYLTILEKQADGSWKIAIDCFNYDAPL
ncbi:MAG: SgcJ/EcaC family oxidoreductase, partial [Phycisphaerales bacterium]